MNNTVRQDSFGGRVATISLVLGGEWLALLERLAAKLHTPLENAAAAALKDWLTTYRAEHAQHDDEIRDLYVEDPDHLGQWSCARCGAPLAYDPLAGLYCATCDVDHDQKPTEA